MKYWTPYAIWIWFLLAASLMYWHFTNEQAWGAPLVYVFFLVCHASYYQHRKKKLVGEPHVQQP